jgi:hypothetical protein
MQIVEETLSKLHIGDPTAFEGLAMFPLLGGSGTAADPGYATLDEALERGSARVTEIGEGGSVPELLFENLGEHPVLLLDGEELVGAKQNRVLNLTILAPAAEVVTIPVSCVEAGRWGYRTRSFRGAGRAQYARGRARKAGSVSASLREGSRHSDQGEVWDDIRAKSERMGVSSPTAAMASLFDAEQGRLDDFVAALRPVAGQRGAVFAIGGRVAGLELFDHPRTLAASLPKIVRSYALDAVEERGADAGAADLEPAARRFVERVAAAPFQSYLAVGIGSDLRLDAEGLAGGGLEAEGRLVHLCVFAAQC